MQYSLKFEVVGQTKSEKRENVLSSLVEDKDITFNKIFYSETPMPKKENGMFIRLEGVDYQIVKVIYEYIQTGKSAQELTILQIESCEEVEKNTLNG